MPVPHATYRVQVSPSFDLWQAAGVAEYLADLGVSHFYSSPLLEATSGSMHGYDVVDHSRVSEQLGGEAARHALCGALKAHRLGMVVDIVPNHVGVADASANKWWWDVLLLGPQSAYARYFDIDWSRGRLVLPILGDAPDELDHLRVEDGELRYYEHRFPLAVGTGGGTPREVHDHQHYELVPWRRGNAEVNYRRFFAVSTLAAIRVEEPEVFETTHREVLRWATEGDLDGIRIDHPDGLADPTGYLERLAGVAPTQWLIVEKILEPGEVLPAPWPCAGTTGYDALTEVDSVFVDRAGEPILSALQTELAGPQPSWDDLVHDCKLDVASDMQRAEVARMARLVPETPDADQAIAEALACFPVYRSYLPDVGGTDLATALAEAVRRRPDLAGVLEALSPRLHDPADELAIRFQQQSGAVMAKGVEDTAYYRATRFVAANEVGGDPARIGRSVTDFHAAARRRLDRHPAGMTTLSTHDTKRAEDVRARLAVLAELPGEWADAVRRWTAAAPLPDGAFANLLWQTVAGSWPIERDRLHAYLEKAAREARTATSWDDPDERFEQAMHAVADRVYDDPDLRADVEAFVGRITPYGWSNSLGAKLVQLTMPGVPDVYQGSELWDNSLVDPDNRRPVDFTRRRALLAALDDGLLPEVDDSGAAKLLVTSRALRLRRDQPELFTGYVPLSAAGPAAEQVLAFDRGGAITVATLGPAGLDRAAGWLDTTLTLPGEGWTDVLTGAAYDAGPVPVGDLLDRYPVALLTAG
ncbi:MAG TPA: malto-oligosyltrehalose synthase [Mycobacteriales bacterium]